MKIEMNKNVQADDLLSIEMHRPYFAKCISSSDDYSYHEYYVIEKTYNDVFCLYNTGIEVWDIIELSVNEIGE